MKLRFVRLIQKSQRISNKAFNGFCNTMSWKRCMRFPRLVSILLGMIILSAGCGTEKPETPKDLIPEDEYVLLMAEFQLIEAYLKNTKDTVKAVQKTNYVLDSYDVTMDQFKSSTQYYEYDIDGQYKRVQRASDLLSRSIK